MANRLVFPLSKFSELRRFAWSCQSLKALRLLLLVVLAREEQREIADLRRASAPPAARPATGAESLRISR